MKPVAPTAISAAVGAVLGLVVIFGGTALVSQNSRPDIDRSGNADSSLLNQVEYGNR